MLTRFRHSLKHCKDRGASAVEYGLMVAAIAAVIVGIVFGLGKIVQSSFQSTCDSIKSGQANATSTC